MLTVSVDIFDKRSLVASIIIICHCLNWNYTTNVFFFQLCSLLILLRQTSGVAQNRSSMHTVQTIHMLVPLLVHHQCKHSAKFTVVMVYACILGKEISHLLQDPWKCLCDYHQDCRQPKWSTSCHILCVIQWSSARLRHNNGSTTGINIVQPHKKYTATGVNIPNYFCRLGQQMVTMRLQDSVAKWMWYHLTPTMNPKVQQVVLPQVKISSE